MGCDNPGILCKKPDCDNCGHDPREAALRRRAIARDGLKPNEEGLKRLLLKRRED